MPSTAPLAVSRCTAPSLVWGLPTTQAVRQSKPLSPVLSEIRLSDLNRNLNPNLEYNVRSPDQLQVSPCKYSCQSLSTKLSVLPATDETMKGSSNEHGACARNAAADLVLETKTATRLPSLNKLCPAHASNLTVQTENTQMHTHTHMQSPCFKLLFSQRSRQPVKDASTNNWH